MIGFDTITMYLNKEVAVNVAATEIKAVVIAVVMTMVDGIGTSKSVKGTSTICVSGGLGMGAAALGCGVLCCGGASVVLIPLTPGGGLRVLGRAQSGL